MTGVNNDFVGHGNTPYQKLSLYYMKAPEKSAYEEKCYPAVRL